MSRLADCLNEQHALIAILLGRAANPSAGERAFSPTHLRRAIYAHLAVVKVVASGLEGQFPADSLAHASSTVTACLAQLLLTKDEDPDKYMALSVPLRALFSVERAVISGAMLSWAEKDLIHAAFAAEEQFEVLYGRGELASERSASQMGAL